VSAARRFARSFRLAGRGLRFAWVSQPHVRFEAVVAAIACAAAAWLGHGWLSVVLASALVLTAELINTAVEAVVDLLAPDPHPLAERAKDVAAGAVLIASGFALLVGVTVFGPPLWSLITGGWR